MFTIEMRLPRSVFRLKLREFTNRYMVQAIRRLFDAVEPDTRVKIISEPSSQGHVQRIRFVVL